MSKTKTPSQKRADHKAKSSLATDHPREVLSDDQQALAPATEGRDVTTKSKGRVTQCAGDRRLGHAPGCPVDLAGDDDRVELARDFSILGYEEGRVFSKECATLFVAWRPERIS